MTIAGTEHPDRRTPTLKDIAREAGASIETVSRVLGGKYRQVGDKGRKRVEQITAIAQRLGYRPHAGARSMRGGLTRLIGVVVANDSLYGHPVVLSTLAGINEALETEGFAMVLVRVQSPLDSVSLTSLTSLESQDDDDASPPAAPAPALTSRMVDALIIVDPMPTALRDDLRALVPCCIEVNTGRTDAERCVMRDEKGAGAAIAEYLISQGYRRALYLDMTHRRSPILVQRKQGFQRTFTHAGGALDHCALPLPPERIVDEQHDDQQLDDTWPDLRGSDRVVVCADVPTVLAVQTHCLRLGLRPGRDLGLACLDEVNGMGQTWPQLTRIASHRIRLGAAAARLAVGIVTGADAEGASITVPATLIPGSTCPRMGAVS